MSDPTRNTQGRCGDDSCSDDSCSDDSGLADKCAETGVIEGRVAEARIAECGVTRASGARSRRPNRNSLAAALAVAACVATALAPHEAAAQDFGPPSSRSFSPSGPPSQRRQPAKKKESKPSDAPETHAASGADDTLLPPGGEPNLPEKPLELPPGAAKVIGSDADPDLTLRTSDRLRRRFYGLYYSEAQGDHEFETILPPLWFERTQPSATNPDVQDTASLWGPYYRRRSAEHADDVVFPLFWNLREPDLRTTVVGPWMQQRGTDRSSDWLAPLYFHGRQDQKTYTLIPPLLTYLSHDEDHGFNLIGPAYCKWQRGASCDADTADRIALGVAPFYFYGKDRDTEYRTIPPLLHYHREDRRDDTSFDLFGPVFLRHGQEQESVHVFPFFFSHWGKDSYDLTVAPLFHRSKSPERSMLITPLFMTAENKEGHSTFVSWLYARHRGDSELDMLSPLVWLYRDEAVGVERTLVLPFYYRGQGPRENDRVYFPFYAQLERQGLSTTRWITPLFQHKSHLRGWSASLYPLFYIGRDDRETHTVIAPLFWDFANPTSRSTVGFPIYWRFTEGNSTSQLIGNVYYSEKKVPQGSDWEVHLFPFFSYGARPDGHFWNVLYGLAGYSRRGSVTEAKTFWIPIKLSE